MGKMKQIAEATDALLKIAEESGVKSAWVTPSRKRWNDICRQVMAKRPDVKIGEEDELIFSRTGAVVIPIITNELLAKQSDPRTNETIH